VAAALGVDGRTCDWLPTANAATCGASGVDAGAAVPHATGAG
jgi:hypothetical protein